MKLIFVGAVIATATCIGVLACVGDDPERVDREPTNDGGVGGDGGSAQTDGATATDTGVVAGDNILPRGGFEDSPNCLGWKENGAALTNDPLVHGGTSSCQVCDSKNGTGNPVWGLFQNISPGIPPGTYEARMFARTSGDAGPFGLDLVLQPIDGAEVEVGESGKKELIIAPNDSEWGSVIAQVGVQAGQGVAVGVFSQTAGGCFLVDDITLVKK